MKPTLFLLAAGMGSRYGGLKQLDGLGPNGETIMDYSIYDAIQAGFGKLVFVIRKDFEQDFRDKIISKYEGHIPCELVFQSLDDLPEGFKCPEGRVKPWGTNHAVLMGKNVINEPFCVINCDDFYNRDAFMAIGKFLSELPEGSKNKYAMVGFRCCNTLSENGSVSRGICSVDDAGNLAKVVEHTKIFRRDGAIVSVREDGSEVPFTGSELVSMNSWGFSAGLVGELERLFTEFLRERGSELKSEFYLPFAVDTLIRERRAEIKVLRSEDSWFGITYREDKPFVQAALKKLVASGAYPEKLFA